MLFLASPFYLFSPFSCLRPSLVSAPLLSPPLSVSVLTPLLSPPLSYLRLSPSLPYPSLVSTPSHVSAHQTQLYKHVIEDVVRNMREEYLNEGMDTELLEELKQVSHTLPEF